MPTPFSANHLHSPTQMSPPPGSLPGLPSKVQNQFSLTPVYSWITALFKPYNSRIYFSFQRLCGEFLESTNILKDKRVHWAKSVGFVTGHQHPEHKSSFIHPVTTAG